jgi:hypothetical protein
MSPCLPVEFYFHLPLYTYARVDSYRFFNLHIKKARNRVNVEDDMKFKHSNTDFEAGSPDESTTTATIL